MKKTTRNLIFLAVVSVLSIAAHAQDWTDGSFTLWNSFGSQGTGDGQFLQADGIAVDENGLIYVSDYQLHRIQVFQADGTFVRKWGAQGSGDGQFQNPRGLNVGPDGNLYVCDWGNHRIQVFQPDGTFVREWGIYGTGNGQFNHPYRISVNDSGQVFVADHDNKRVQVFGEGGNYIRQFSTVTSSETLTVPLAIAALNDSSVFVGQVPSQSAGAYMVRYDAEGVRGVSVPNISWNYWSTYGGLDVSRSGNVFSSCIYFSGEHPDGAGINIRIFDDQSSLVEEFGRSDPLYRCVNLALMPDQSLVSIRDNFTIHVRRWLRRTIGLLGDKLGYWAKIENVGQRAGYPYLDIDFCANSDNGKTNANVAMCAFLDGNIDLASLIPMRTFVDGTETNLGENVELSSDLERVTWNMAADWSAESGDVQVQAFVQDGAYYIPFNFLTIPAGGDVSNAFQICRTPVTSADLKAVWLFLIASNDSDVELVDGTVYGTSGSYDGVALASDSGTTTSGKNFLWERMSLRDPTDEELAWAKEATIPGIQKWTPRSKVGGRPSYINEFGLDTGATTGFWAVKQ